MKYLNRTYLAAVVASGLASSGLGQWVEFKSQPAGLVDDDAYGFAVAVTGDVAHVCALGNSPMEPVRVLGRDVGGPGNWGVIKLLTVANTSSFGRALAASGNLLLVGAPGSLPQGTAHLFHRNAGGADNWGQIKVFGTTEPSSTEQFGLAVAIDGDTAVVGVPLDHQAGFSAGSVSIYRRDAGGPDNWGRAAQVLASDAAAWSIFGFSVAVSGDTVAVGAADPSASPVTGAVYLYQRDLGGPEAWGELTKLTPSPKTFSGFYGESVALVGDTLAIGDRSDSEQGGSAGAVHLLERDRGGPNAWGTSAKIFSDPIGPGQAFGEAVALTADERRLVVGAAYYDGLLLNQGAAYVFDRHQGGVDAWGQVAELLPSDPMKSALFGLAVAATGDTALIGAPQAGPFGFRTGAAYFYEPASPPLTYCTAGISASGCSASILASGTPSATAPTGFFLSAVGVEGQKDGQFYYGTSGPLANPWGNGTSYRCVAPPSRRGGLLGAMGTTGECDGVFSQDLNARWSAKPAHNPGPGATVQAQLWHRDPQNTSNQTTSFSDALQFDVAP